MKKTLKESIQKTVKESILKEKWTDAPAAVASGVANSFRNIGGQYGLGKIQNRLDRVGARIEKDWNDSAEEASKTAQKLIKSKNPMIAQQGQAFMQKVQGIEQSMDRTLKLFDVPVGDQMSGQGGEDDPNLDFDQMPEGKQFNLWLKKVWHGNPDTMTATETEKARSVYNQIKSYNIDPMSPGAKLGPVQKMIDLAKAQEEKDQARIRQQHGLEGGEEAPVASGGKGQKKAAIQGMIAAWKKKNPNATKNEKEIFKHHIKDLMKMHPEATSDLPISDRNQKHPKVPSIAQMKNTVSSNVVRPPGPNAAAKPAAAPVPAPVPANPGFTRPPGVGGAKPPPPEPIAQPEPNVPDSIKGMVGDGNWNDPDTLGKKPEVGKTPEMQSPANTKGKAAPPPLPPNPNPYQSVAPPPAPIPLTKKKEEEPVPLTNLKPVAAKAPKASATAAMSHRPEDTSAQMPPEENVPSSIKGMLPPIKDDGQEIQVGSADQPSFSPSEDVLHNRQPSIEKLKAKAERTRDPKDQEALKKALEKEVISKKAPQKKK